MCLGERVDEIADVLSKIDQYDTLFISDEHSVLPVSESRVQRVNIHEQRRMSFLFDYVQDMKLGTSARVLCRRYGLPENPANAAVATYVGTL